MFGMETKEDQRNAQFENEHLSKLRRGAIDQLGIGSTVLLWGSLLALKQVGIIDKNVSTWPFPLTLFGVLLVAGGIYRVYRSRCLSVKTNASEMQQGGDMLWKTK
jgi:hypothetical protein